MPLKIVRSLALRTLLPLLPSLGSRTQGAFGILMYHRITPVVSGVPRPTWNVPPRQFHRQVAGLLAGGWRPWPLRQVLDHSRRGRPVPPKTFVVTFDDGYENVYTNAWPVLRALGVPATVFLATAYLDSDAPFPCDDWTAAGSDRVPMEAWRPLTTAQCREMMADGLIELGAHTHTHADCRGRPDDLYRDLLVCREELAARFGLTDATFAFPYGTKRLGFSGPVLAAAARRAGLLCSLTTESELVEPGSDPFDWGRFNVEDTDTAATLAARLDGWYSLARAAWRRLRRRNPHGRTPLSTAAHPNGALASESWGVGVGCTEFSLAGPGVARTSKTCSRQN